MTVELPPIRSGVALAPFTTLRLGGPAALFAECLTTAHVVASLHFAREQGVRLFVMGGGSNLIVPDEGVDGLVLKIGMRGITAEPGSSSTLVTVQAGEQWDDVVRWCVRQSLGGIECLSGIPGTAGATPVQNVGAYGQEVAETISHVVAIDRQTGEETVIPKDACGFSYRQSRFKKRDRERYIITTVSFRLENDALPSLRYPELRKRVEEAVPDLAGQRGSPGLLAVRDLVLALRRSKAMVIDPSEPDTRSVGSFFLNPLVAPSVLEYVRNQHAATGEPGEVPHFPTGELEKIPAAWLVEHAGFRRGYTEGGVGISRRHALALVNRGGTTHELLGLAARIEEIVRRRFGISLEREPVLFR